ncbi:MAG: type VI secretion system lipoprotein TssJ [Pseudomonas sp.]
MAITDFNARRLSVALVLALSSMLAGCGLTQTVADGTVSVTQSIFYKQVKILHLDLAARGAINNNQNGAPLATVVRVYQLKDRKAFDAADYHALSATDGQALSADVLARHDKYVQPDATVSLDKPMEKDTRYVAVVALFHSPEIEHGNWRVVLERDELDPDKPRLIELNDNRLALKPLTQG